MSAELSVAAKQLQNDYTLTGSYPGTLTLGNSGGGVVFNQGYAVSYTPGASTFCLSVTKGSIAMQVTPVNTISSGSCNVMAGATATDARIIDGNTASSPYYDAGSGVKSVIIDLGSVKVVGTITVWHYYADSRTYNGAKTEVSADNISWTTVYDSAVSGLYQETSAGKTFSFSPLSVRYIRDTTNGSSANTSNHWVEIKAS